MNNKQLMNFVTSHNTTTHPLVSAKKKTQIRYYCVLDYLVGQCANDDEYVHARLAQYRTMLVKDEAITALTDENCDSTIRSMINDRLRPWMWKYRFWLVCDMALITAEREAIEKALEIIQKYLRKQQFAALDTLVSSLFFDDVIPEKLLFAEALIDSFRINRNFMLQPEMRILITANMSAGKSTLINAIMGKPIAKTAQEACTANLCYFLNKPIEDHSVHLLTSKLNLDASTDDLINAENTSISYIASYFRTLVSAQARICLIDTPGVNSAMNLDHGKLARKALIDEKYDKLIYVLNATRLGADDESRYLKYLAENVPKEKVVFVLNKLDDFKKTDDSIAVSIEGVRNDLLQLGYKNPVICPISAYFALLVKLKQNGEQLNEDEQDAYNLYRKKFSKAEYDLSKYFAEVGASIQPLEDESLVLARKCGLYGLENVLYGGVSQ